MPRCLLMLLGTFLLVLSTVVAASIPSLRQRRADQKQLTLSGDDIVALERILADVDKVLGSVQVKLCSSSEANSAQCKLAAQASRPGYTPDNIARELKSGESMVEDVARKRLGLKLLQRYLSSKERQLDQVRKRNCKFNLGGHCATETVADMVDLYHFLSSADSPGRRKRRHAANQQTKSS